MTHDLSVAAIRRLESGTLVSVPPTLPPEISQAIYEEWKRYYRSTATKQFLSTRAPALSGHPFAGICTGFTANAIAEQLLVPQKTVSSYLESKRATVPREIITALKQADYSRLNDLIALQRKFSRD